MPRNATTMPRLVDATAIAESLGVHRTTAWRRLARGDFGQPIDIGGGGNAQWRVTEDQFQDWLKSRRSPEAA